MSGDEGAEGQKAVPDAATPVSATSPGTPGARPVEETRRDADPAGSSVPPVGRSAQAGGLRRSAAPDPATAVTPGLQPVATTPLVPQPPVGPTPRFPAAVEPPSPDVAPVEAESALPGKHRGGFERWPTAPIGVTPVVTAPDLDAPVQWAPIEPAAPSRGMSAWALVFGILGLVVAMFVGWGFPLGIAAIVTAIIALRRPLESRAVAVWGLVLGAVSLLYSAGWLLYAATRTDLLALLT